MAKEHEPWIEADLPRDLRTIHNFSVPHIKKLLSYLGNNDSLIIESAGHIVRTDAGTRDIWFQKRDKFLELIESTP